MTDDLVTWLRAQLDLDQQHAEKDLWCVDRATAGGQWDVSFGYNLPYSVIKAGGDEIGRLTAMPQAGWPDGAELPHASDGMLVGRMVRSAKSRAERVLREVEAKRRILDSRDEATRYAARDNEPSIHHIAETFDGVVRLLALPYMDRPGYREEWRPDAVASR